MVETATALLIAKVAAAGAATASAGLQVAQATGGGPITPDSTLADKKQKEQEKALAKRQAEEDKQKISRQKITAAAQSRRGVGTLFRRTGEFGVKLGESKAPEAGAGL